MTVCVVAKKPVCKDWLFLFGRAPKAPVYAETSLPPGGDGRGEGRRESRRKGGALDSA